MQMMQQQYFSPNMNMPISAGMEGMGMNFDQENQQQQHYFQHAHVVNNSMMPERSMSQPDLRIETGHRPYTPEEQIHTGEAETTPVENEADDPAGRFPLTPAATPFHQQHHYARSLQCSPIRQASEDIIRSPKPISMQRGRSLQGIVENVEQKSFDYSPPTTAPLVQSSNFDYAEMPVPERRMSQQEEVSFQSQINTELKVHSSPSKPVTPIRSSFEQSSNDETLPFFDETGGEVPQLENHPVPVLSSSQAPLGSMSPNRPALSPRRISITDLNLEPGIKASIEDTNISIDDIAQFIEGPGPVDSKYMCTYEDCGKKFGRKENIKSHVQTHLGDRQFRCDHCKKCFVRGHDLKRHAKIHTGTKPYPCLCGNSFARHDALTRHRQRGMCIGAFEGVVKKDVKRGRPKKRRPEMDDRLDKATRTRRKNQDNLDGDYGSQYDGQYGHYASSASSDSMSSWGSPPTENLEGLSIRGESPYDDMALFGGSIGQQAHMSPGHINMGLPPNVFSQAFTPPTSPPYMGSPYSTGHKPSPAHTHRSLTPTDLVEIPELPTMQIHQLTSMAIQKSHQSLPSLSHSGSSPAAEAFAFDFSDDTTSSQIHMHGGEMKGENIFDPFLNFGNEMDGDGIDFSSL